MVAYQEMSSSNTKYDTKSAGKTDYIHTLPRAQIESRSEYLNGCHPFRSEGKSSQGRRRCQ